MREVMGDALDAAFEASGRRSYLLVVEGRWGAGKTSFIDAAVAEAEEKGLQVVRLDVPDLAPGPSATAPCAFDRHVDDAGQLDPRSIAAAVERSRKGPMLIAVDDAQWLDDLSAEALGVLHDDGTSGLLLVMTMLHSYEASPVVRRLATSTRRRTLHLEPLARDEVRELVTAHYFPAASDDHIEKIHDLTDGIPYFVHEVCSWADVEELELDGISEAMSESVPPPVLKMTRSRLDALDDDERRLTGVLAVLDGHATPVRAAALGAMDEGRVYETIDALNRYGLVDRTWPLRFGPPVLRYAIIQSMSALDMQTLRRSVARLLHDEGEAPRSVAAHLLETPSAGGAQWIVTTCSSAADRAVMQGDHRLAAALLSRALAEPPAPVDRPRLLVGLGRAEALLGCPQATDHLLDALDLSDDAAERGRSLYHLARVHTSAGDGVGAIQYLRRGLAEPCLPSSISTLLMEELRVLDLFDPGLRATHALSRPPGSHGSTVVDQLHRVMAAESADTVLPDLRGAIEAADPDSFDGMTSHAALAGLVWCDALGDADRFLTAAGRHTLTQGGGVLGALWRHGRAVIAYHRGELSQALELARSAADLLMGAWPSASSPAIALAIHTALACGRPSLARELAGVQDTHEPDVPTFASLQLADAIGHLHLEVGRLEDAIDAFRDAAAMATETGIANPAVACWRGGLARALAATGDEAGAQRVAREEVEVARRFGAPRVLASALRGLGQVAAPDAAVPALREAAGLIEHHPAKLERVRVRFALAQALKRAGHRREARDEVHEGLAEARELGAARLVHLLDEEASSLGLTRSSNGGRVGLESLTPSELRVAELAKSGMTNREIATEVFVSSKAVEYHLGNVYAKLGIHGRRELPADLIGREESTRSEVR